MKRTNTITLVLFLCLPFIGHLRPMQTPVDQLPELPLSIYWDDSGLKIRLKRVDGNNAQQLLSIPSRYLEKVGNDLIKINKGGESTPIVIDLSKYLEGKIGYPNGYTRINNSEMHAITVEKNELTGSYYDEHNTFVMVLKYQSGKRKYLRQEILFKGLDVFRPEADKKTKIELDGKHIIVDVRKARTNFLVLRGGTLQIDNIEEVIPNLCYKYNKKFGETEAFVCAGFEGSGEKGWNIDHVRNLITKYNITDFSDEPLAYLKNIIITKKGIGFDLKNIQLGKNSKPKTLANLDSYYFFDWSTFINLKFEKYSTSKQFLMTGPYYDSFIYSGNEFFTNVELIQFMNELNYTISAAMN